MVSHRVARSCAGLPAPRSSVRSAAFAGFAQDRKVRHASVGAAGQALSDIRAFSSHPAFTLTAVADVDRARTEQVKKLFPDVRVYQDWREMFRKEQANIDSVNVSTPDHMHAPIAMAAMAMGKAVYVQKPLALTIRETRVLALKARQANLVTQMGIQISSHETQLVTEQLIRDGAVGKIREVHTFCDKAWGDTNPIPAGADPIPETLDWDGWIGVSEPRPFKATVYHPGNWRKRIGYGTGTLGDMGCHIFSTPLRGLGPHPASPGHLARTGAGARQLADAVEDPFRVRRHALHRRRDARLLVVRRRRAAAAGGDRRGRRQAAELGLGDDRHQRRDPAAAHRLPLAAPPGEVHRSGGREGRRRGTTITSSSTRC